MISRFADTWFFQAMLSEHDSQHARVAAFLGEHDDFMVTTRWVLAETANAAGGSAYREQAAQFLRNAEHDPGILVVGESDALYQRGLDLYIARPDKAWSLTDCISFVVMREQGLDEALTGDRHFEQAGFKAVFAA